MSNFWSMVPGPVRVGMVGCFLAWALTGGLPLVVSPLVQAQQTNDPPDPAEWEGLRFLEGSWQGDIGGALGTGTGIRTYRFIFSDKYLLMEHASVRQPQEASPQGDHHREMGLFSFDRHRERVVYREFMEEGFVLQYTCDVHTDRRGLTCVTENIESGPGMRARLTLTADHLHAFTETFELASAGEELSVLFTNRPGVESLL